MSPQRLQLKPEPTQNEPTTNAEALTETTPPAEIVRTPTDRAPKTFAYRNTERLENLMDEWNAARIGSDSTSE